MNLSGLNILKPNVASLGYALFLAVNATGVWGGVFPFLPLDFQTPKILFWFFLAQSITFFTSFLASGLGAYFLPGPTKQLSAILAGTPYLIGWCCLIAAMYIDELALCLVIVGGALLGLGSAGFYMLWQRLFASRDADTGNRDLIAGTAYAAVIYFALYLVPSAVAAFIIPLVFMPLFGLAIVVQSLTVDRAQPMFQDVPREHPQVYRRFIRDYWRSALSVGALGFCAGIMRSLALGDVSMGMFVNMLSMTGACAMATVMLLLWRFKSLRVNVVTAYRFFFPFVITSFLMLPFLPNEYERWLAAILYALYSVAIVLMMIQCAQASRDHGINPVFVYGLFGSVVYALHDLGFFGGTFLGRIVVLDMPVLAIVALVVVYLLGMMFFVGQGGLRNALGLSEADTSIELVALQPISSVAGTKTADKPGGRAETDETGGRRKEKKNSDQAWVTRTEAASDTDAPAHQQKTASAAPYRNTLAKTSTPDQPISPHTTPETSSDYLSQQIVLVQRTFRLSARETEVMELIARGYTVARIAEMLVVSENTIRTHSKRIYAKLNVHKRQELRDLIDSFNLQ